jgi:hypothetical protein
MAKDCPQKGKGIGEERVARIKEKERGQAKTKERGRRDRLEARILKKGNPNRHATIVERSAIQETVVGIPKQNL